MTIDNLIEEQWREFYLPYTFGELHSPQTKSHTDDSGVATCTRNPMSLCENKTADTNPEDDKKYPIRTAASGLDNPLEEELYIQQNKYTTEEI